MVVDCLVVVVVVDVVVVVNSLVALSIMAPCSNRPVSLREKPISDATILKHGVRYSLHTSELSKYVRLAHPSRPIQDFTQNLKLSLNWASNTSPAVSLHSAKPTISKEGPVTPRKVSQENKNTRANKEQIYQQI